MSEIQIAWLQLILDGGIGLLLILAGVIARNNLKKKIRACTEQAEGVVKKHKFPGNGRMYPVVEYCVNGRCYKAKKDFYGVKTVKVSGIPVPVQTDAYEDEKGWLCVKMGAVASLRQLAEQMWPIGSKMTVFYDPNKPKKCYVERPLSKSFFISALILSGVIFILLSILVFFLIQL